MGSKIEMNGALQISEKQGFPSELLDVETHHKSPIDISIFEGKIFEFRDKSGARVFQLPPSRNFLIQNLDGKWIYWGMIEVLEQNINSYEEESVTSGKFRLISIFKPDYQVVITKNFARLGHSYF